MIFQAGDSDQGRDLGASVGEGIFTHAPDIPQRPGVLRRHQDPRQGPFGRDPDHLVVMPGVKIVARRHRRGRPRDRGRRQRARPHASRRRCAEFGRPFGWHDFRQYDLDAPFPAEALEHGERCFYTQAKKITQRAADNGWTLRQTVEATRLFRKSEFVGTAETVADKLVEWWEARACDGFNIGIDHPANFRRFVDEVVPILQERGVFRADYESTTLRGNLGLPVPDNRHTPAAAARRSDRRDPPPRPPPRKTRHWPTPALSHLPHPTSTGAPSSAPASAPA